MSKIVCPHCKRETELITIFVKGDEINHCAYCGGTVHQMVKAPQEKENFAVLQKVLIAEDSKLIRQIAKDALLEGKVASDVEVCSNGAELIEHYAKSIREKKTIDLLIVDINMPVLGGLSASVAIRSIEKGLGIPFRVPFLFFTVSRLTEEMRTFFSLVKPAVYLHKGDATQADKLASRLIRGIYKLLQQTNKGKK